MNTKHLIINSKDIKDFKNKQKLVLQFNYFRNNKYLQHKDLHNIHLTKRN